RGAAAPRARAEWRHHLLQRLRLLVLIDTAVAHYRAGTFPREPPARAVARPETAAAAAQPGVGLVRRDDPRPIPGAREDVEHHLPEGIPLGPDELEKLRLRPPGPPDGGAGQGKFGAVQHELGAFDRYLDVAGPKVGADLGCRHSRT